MENIIFTSLKNLLVSDVYGHHQMSAAVSSASSP